MTAADPLLLPRDRHRGQRLMCLASGVFVLFIATGVGSWVSGAASWVGFYAGARGQTLMTLSQVTMAIGFALGTALPLAWYGRRCRRGDADIPRWAALSACLALPVGSICWAIFVDATAWHYGRDIVRPAFDHALMYLVLGGVVPVTFGVPCLVFALRRWVMPGVAHVA